MKILFVSAVFPYPLYSGGQIRIYNLIKALSHKHDITLCSFIRDEKENQYKKELSFCKKIETVRRGRAWQTSYILHSLLGRYPFLLSTYDNSAMRKKLADALKNDTYDLIHIEPGYVWPSIPHTTIPLVVAEHNIEHTIYEDYVRHFPIVPLRPFLYADVLKLMWWEKHIWKAGDQVIAVSGDDKAVIEKTIDPSHVTVVPNGVDLTLFPFAPKKQEGNPVFLFVGNFLWMQNQDAVRFLLMHIWPCILKNYPKATLRIVGKHMPDRLRRLIVHPSVLLLENVSEIQTEYHQADILLAPIRIGGGTKFKILEAMASGVPVVATSKGAAGLTVVNGKHLLIADTPEETVAAAQNVFSDKIKKKAIIQAARKRIEEEYSWEHISNTLEMVWKKAAHEANS